jgi:hypothetical protein
MTFGHSHELLVVTLEGFGGFLPSLTQKHRNVEEADLTTSVTPRGLALAARRSFAVHLAYATPRHRARAEVFAMDPSKLNPQFGLPAGAE